MKKLAKDIKKNDKLNIFGKPGIVEDIEISDIGKQGKRKVRIQVNVEGNKTIMIRPEDYPLDVLE